MSDLRRTVIPMMLLGDGQVGKTSLISRLTGKKFDDSPMTTIGKETYLYDTILHDINIKIKIFDTAGQERFKSMSANVIKNVEGLILTYSIESKESFNNLDNWLHQLNNVSDISKTPIILVGNKSDLKDLREVDYEEGEDYAKDHEFHFFETSAKTGENVKEAFDYIFELLYKKLEEEITGKKGYVKQVLVIKKNKEKKQKCC
jgi:small GTP-binding protein